MTQMCSCEKLYIVPQGEYVVEEVELSFDSKCSIQPFAVWEITSKLDRTSCRHILTMPPPLFFGRSSYLGMCLLNFKTSLVLP